MVKSNNFPDAQTNKSNCISENLEEKSPAIHHRRPIFQTFFGILSSSVYSFKNSIGVLYDQESIRSLQRIWRKKGKRGRGEDPLQPPPSDPPPPTPQAEAVAVLAHTLHRCARARSRLCEAGVVRCGWVSARFLHLEFARVPGLCQGHTGCPVAPPVCLTPSQALLAGPPGGTTLAPRRGGRVSPGSCQASRQPGAPHPPPVLCSPLGAQRRRRLL